MTNILRYRLQSDQPVTVTVIVAPAPGDEMFENEKITFTASVAVACCSGQFRKVISAFDSKLKHHLQKLKR